MTTRFAILDCETTGLHARRGDRMIELAVLVVDEHFDEVDRLDSLIAIDVPVAATNVHGIRDADLVGAPSFVELLPRLRALLGGATVVAHYAKFDIGFLHAELLRAGARDALCDHVVDTRDLARAAGIVGGLRLRDCCEEFGIANDRPHRAMGDVLTTRDLMRACEARGVHAHEHARAWDAVLGSTLPRSEHLPQQRELPA